MVSRVARSGAYLPTQWNVSPGARSIPVVSTPRPTSSSTCFCGKSSPITAITETLGAMTATDDGARAALDLLSRMRRNAEAAVLAERLGDIARAIELYSRAHKELDAARLLEREGRDRDAGRLLERALDLAA